MSNYRETTLNGASWIRAYRVTAENPLQGQPYVRYDEEWAINPPEGAPITRRLGALDTEFTVENAGTSFQLINPVTMEVIPGATATYQDLYVLLYSLYWALAEARDNAGGTPFPVDPIQVASLTPPLE
jgi:hypothetical protein